MSMLEDAVTKRETTTYYEFTEMVRFMVDSHLSSGNVFAEDADPVIRDLAFVDGNGSRFAIKLAKTRDYTSFDNDHKIAVDLLLQSVGLTEPSYRRAFRDVPSRQALASWMSGKTTTEDLLAITESSGADL